jgi:hypothetical protein
LKVWKQKQEWVFSEIESVFEPTPEGWDRVSDKLEECLEEIVRLALKEMLSSARDGG